MKKTPTILLTAALLLAGLDPSHAGGLVTNTNQSIHFDRMFARGASTDIDAVYTNPAGTAFMDDGIHLSLNVQTVKQTRTIDTDFALFENGRKPFKGRTFVPVYPQAYAALKRGDWAFSLALTAIGGGGQCEFKQGLPSFEASIAGIPALLTQQGIQTSRYQTDIYLNGEQFIYSVQAGASRRVSGHVSAYMGVRLNWVSNHYDGHIRSIRINPLFSGNPGAEMIPAPEFFQTLSSMTASSDPAVSAMAKAYAQATSDMALDMDQHGFGITPVLGADIRAGRWNFGLKYEFNTDIETKNKTAVNTLPAGKKEPYDDKVETAADIPSVFTFGAQYAVRENLRAAVGFHHFGDRHANLPDNREDLIDHGINEYLWGMEWDCAKRLTLSCGMQFTQSGVKDEYQSELNFSLSSFSYGFGGAYRLSPAATVQFGYFCTKYDTWRVSTASYNGSGLPGRNSYDRTSDTFGLGVDFSF